MALLTIKMNQKDLKRIDSALMKIARIAHEQKKFGMTQACADEYRLLVINNLLTQKFATGYRPYSPKYAKWKTQTMMLGSQFWRLYGDLVNNIEVFKVGDTFMGGIKAGVMDSGGKSWFSTPARRLGKPKEIVMYAKKLEKDRPLFEPTRQEYKNSGYPARGILALRKIGAGWK